MVLPTIHGNESYGTPETRRKRAVDMVIDDNIPADAIAPDSDAALREAIAAKHAEREAEIAARQAQVIIKDA